MMWGLMDFDLITLAIQSFINDHLVGRFSLNFPSIMKCFRHFIRHKYNALVIMEYIPKNITLSNHTVNLLYYFCSLAFSVQKTNFPYIFFDKYPINYNFIWICTEEEKLKQNLMMAP